MKVKVIRKKNKSCVTNLCNNIIPNEDDIIYCDDCKIININNLKEELYNDFKNIDKSKIDSKYAQYKSKNPDNYYWDQVFTGNLDDIEKIQIELVIIPLGRCSKTDKLRDIWNFYRDRVSSLKKSCLHGRQIYILVKDKTSQKYIGIVSLNSDIQSMQSRDMYIGWTKELRITHKHLNYLMNLSTCVPLTPFGFNFCGGKLLACLAFSKEISEEFYKRYNNPLFGITTTSLYGKSIQYDRLKCLKFMGYTKGTGTVHIPDSTYKKCLKLLKLLDITVSEKHISSCKIKKIYKVLQILDIPRKPIFFHGQSKGIYFGFTFNNSKILLNNELLPSEWNDIKLAEHGINYNNLKSAQEIFTFWKERYAIKRYNHLCLTRRLTRKVNQDFTYKYQKKFREMRIEKYGIEEVRRTERESKNKNNAKKRDLKEDNNDKNKTPDENIIEIIKRQPHTSGRKENISKALKAQSKYDDEVINDIIDCKKKYNYTNKYISQLLTQKYKEMNKTTTNGSNIVVSISFVQRTIKENK